MKLNAEIVAVGTELLLGQIANTNAQWISEQLAKLGINVFYHSVVGDNLDRVKNSFEIAKSRSNLIIITGGLGPTDDDLTRDAAQAILNRKLKTDDASMKKIEDYFNKNKRQMSPNNRKQALVFEGSKVLANDEGMAPGMYLKDGETAWVFMPGVPREMKSIMSKHVIPTLQEDFLLDAVLASRMMRFIGIGEAQLEHVLHEIINNQTNPTIAPLASDGEVALRLTAKASSLEEAEQLILACQNEVLSVVGEYCYGFDEDTIERKIFSLLNEQKKTIASAESLTGGRFIESLISIPGASSVVKGSIVSYGADVKENTLGVPKLIIKNYGTISEACALSMAVNVQSKLNSDLGISFTGVAGPDMSEGKPVGTVFIGIQDGNKEPFVKEFHFSGSRETIRARAVKKAYELLYHYLKK